MNEAELRNLWEIRKSEWANSQQAKWCNECDDNWAEYCDCEYEKHRRKQLGNACTEKPQLQCEYCDASFGSIHSPYCDIRGGKIRKWKLEN